MFICDFPVFPFLYPRFIKVTRSNVVYSSSLQIGAVSDDELLELLHLALSSDTSNTVKRARELMRSRIDPMQLVSQLANLIMDILAGKCQRSACEVKDRLFSGHICKYTVLLLFVLLYVAKHILHVSNQVSFLDDD